MIEKRLWKDILECIYGTSRKLNENGNSGLVSRWWSDLRRVFGIGVERNWFDKNIKLEIGTKTKIWFLEDQVSFCIVFQRVNHFSIKVWE